MMVNSISINRSALERMFEEPDVNEKILDYVPTTTEFVILNDLANLLLPMKQFIKILSSQKYPSLSLLFPMYQHLAYGDGIKGLKIINKEVSALKEWLIMTIKWRFDYVEKSGFLKAATFLDFRYRNFSFFTGQTGKKYCLRVHCIKEAKSYLEGVSDFFLTMLM